MGSPPHTQPTTNNNNNNNQQQPTTTNKQQQQQQQQQQQPQQQQQQQRSQQQQQPQQQQQQQPVQALTTTKLGMLLAGARLENRLQSPTSLHVLPTVTWNLAAAALSSVQQEVYAISTRSVNQLSMFLRTSSSV